MNQYRIRRTMTTTGAICLEPWKLITTRSVAAAFSSLFGTVVVPYEGFEVQKRDRHGVGWVTVPVEVQTMHLLVEDFTDQTMGGIRT